MRNIIPVTLLVVSIICLILAGVVAYDVWDNYKFFHEGNVHLNDKKLTIADLGTVLSGTAGLLVTVAGIFLLLLTIYQTQRELAETRTIMNSQLVESTFFNLLKNHKEVILGLDTEVFNDAIGVVKQNLSSYSSSIRMNHFLDAGVTKLHPKFLYKDSIFFQNLGKSMIHIANLIERNMVGDNLAFYHQTFYYTLSDDEKFLLGMIIENQLEKDSKFKFDYCEYYNANCSYKNPVATGYFPPVKIHAFHTNVTINVPSFDITDEFSAFIEPHTEFHIEYGEHEMPVSKIRYRGFDNDRTTEINGSFDVAGEKPNFSRLFYERNFQTFLRTQKRIKLALEFSFLYKGKTTWVALPIVIVKYETLIVGERNYGAEVDKIAKKYNSINVVQILMFFEGYFLDKTNITSL